MASGSERWRANLGALLGDSGRQRTVRNTFIDLPAENSSDDDYYNSPGSPSKRNLSAPSSPTRRMHDDDYDSVEEEEDPLAIPSYQWAPGGFTQVPQDEEVRVPTQKLSESAASRLWLKSPPGSPKRVRVKQQIPLQRPALGSFLRAHGAPDDAPVGSAFGMGYSNETTGQLGQQQLDHFSEGLGGNVGGVTYLSDQPPQSIVASSASIGIEGPVYIVNTAQEEAIASRHTSKEQSSSLAAGGCAGQGHHFQAMGCGGCGPSMPLRLGDASDRSPNPGMAWNLSRQLYGAPQSGGCAGDAGDRRPDQMYMDHQMHAVMNNYMAMPAACAAMQMVHQQPARGSGADRWPMVGGYLEGYNQMVEDQGAWRGGEADYQQQQLVAGGSRQGSKESMNQQSVWTEGEGQGQLGMQADQLSAQAWAVQGWGEKGKGGVAKNQKRGKGGSVAGSSNDNGRADASGRGVPWVMPGVEAREENNKPRLPLGGGGPKRTDYLKKYGNPTSTPGEEGSAGATIAGGKPAITTMMLRNIPCRKSQEDVAANIDSQGFANRYDFLYLPRDVKFRANLGYAFINFLTAEDAKRFKDEMNGYRFPGSGSCKACEVVPAHVQGVMNNLSAFKRTEVMRSSRKPYFSGLVAL